MILKMNADMLEDCIQRLCDKYHCKCEKFVDFADNEKLDFYVGIGFNRYLLYRIYLDDILSIESFMSNATKALDTYDLNKIDKVWKELNVQL